MLISKIIVVLFLLAILASLGTALIHMIRDKGQSDRAVKALTVRIALSVSLFILLFVGFATGVISPHGL